MISPPSRLSVETHATAWPPSARVAFRLAFVYIALFCLDNLANIIAELIWIAHGSAGAYPDSFIAPVWHAAIPWIGKHAFHVDVTTFPSDSSDTMYNWVALATHFSVAVVATGVWSALASSRIEHRRLHAWLRLFVRLDLAIEMFSYGMGKVVPIQFGSLGLTALALPMGARSPMTVLWDFMAASPTYTIFAGAVEVLGGLLLLVPQLATLGALVCAGAMANVFMLNVGYDVPVKLDSSHYLFLSMFLLVPELPRLAKVFVLNERADPARIAVLSTRRLGQHVANATVLAAGVVALAAFTIADYHEYVKREAKAALHGDLYGVWNVDELTTGAANAHLLSNKLMKGLSVDPKDDMWTRLVFESRDEAVIVIGADLSDRVDVKINGSSFVFSDSGDPAWRGEFEFQRKGEREMVLEGTVNGHQVTAKLHREQQVFKLSAGRVHWVSEHGYY